MGAMKGEKVGCAVGKRGIDVIRLGGDRLQRHLTISVELEWYLFNCKYVFLCK